VLNKCIARGLRIKIRLNNKDYISLVIDPCHGTGWQFGDNITILDKHLYLLRIMGVQIQLGKQALQ